MPLNYCCSKPNLRCPAFQKPQCAFQGIILRQVICWTSVILPSECRKSSQGQDTKPHCFAPPFSTSNCGERIHPQTSWRGHSPYPPCCSSLEPKDPQQRWIIALFTPGSGKKKKNAAMLTVVTACFSPDKKNATTTVTRIARVQMVPN